MSTSNPSPNEWATSNLDPSLVDADIAIEYESEILIGRRAFSTAQAVFSAFTGVDITYVHCTVAWHGTKIDVNEGSFAVVQQGGRLESLVGEIVRVTIGKRSVLCYVVGSSGEIPTEISLTRRAFMAVGLLAQPTAGTFCRVEVCV